MVALVCTINSPWGLRDAGEGTYGSGKDADHLGSGMRALVVVLLGMALMCGALGQWDPTQPRLVLLGKRRLAKGIELAKKVPSRMVLLGKRGNAEIVNGMLAYDFDKLMAAGR